MASRGRAHVVSIPMRWVSPFIVLFGVASPCVRAQVVVTSDDCIRHGTIDDGTGDPSCDPDWNLKHTGADRAKEKIRTERNEEPGEGIVVAVLDTGYALQRASDGTDITHPELGDVLIEERGYSFECDQAYDRRQEDDPSPCDPDERAARDRMDHNIIPFGRQPGHGTRTTSVLASPDGAQVEPSPNTNARVSGVAPGVRVVPMRASQGSVLMEKRAWDMSRAIARVLLDDPDRREPDRPAVDVISMSFGRRSPYTHLEKAVLMAERRGVIVVAAAGQGSIDPHGGAVRFPAQYPSVVAAGGTRVDARPWTGLFYSSAKGRALDVAAPAVDVWCAEATGTEGHVAFSILRATGTSYATPQTAGAAALWLQWYGRDALQARYGRSALPAAFILHLRTNGFRTPAEMADLADEKQLPNRVLIRRKAGEGWPADMGPGILAVDKLIDLPIGALPTRVQVCRFIYEERGAEALASLCPPRDCPDDPAASCEEDAVDVGSEVLPGALRRPAYHVDPKVSVVAALLFGLPFGSRGDSGEWYSPVLSFGVILDRHQYTSPGGILLQARGGEHGVGAGVGYAKVEDYGPLRNAEGKYSTIPGFGGMFGYTAEAAWLYTDHTHHVGFELGGTLYRARLSLGLYWPIDSETSSKVRGIASLGFGF